MELEQEKKYFEIVSRQSNIFIESPFTQEYSEQELKTMEYVISTITKADIELAKNRQIKIIQKPVAEFAQMIGAHPDDLYKRANLLAEGLLNKRIKFKILDDNGSPGFVKHTIFTDMAYKNGQFIIGINPFVLPYFVDVSKEFTEFRLANILRIGSSYGIKLYKLLKQYENSTWQYRDFSIEALREQFGISNDKDDTGKYLKYNRYNSFKTDVFEVAINHINKHTDLIVSYSESKLSRKVAKLRFYIKSKLTQYEQARIIFSEFMDSLPDTRENSTLKYFWDQEKNKENRIDNFSKAFNCWIDLSCRNFIPVSTDILNAESESSLFYDKEAVIKDIIKAQLSK